MDHRQALFFSKILWMVFLISGCAGARTHGPTLARVGGSPGHFTAGQILDLREGKAVAFPKLMDQIASMELIFIGEVHDNPEHHLLQVQILQALLACCQPLTIAMEFLQKQCQTPLDQYLRDEISETEFLELIDWKREWGFSFNLYRPLLLLAKQSGSRILAINAPRPVVQKVARQGLKGLDQIERKEIAADFDLENEGHRAYLREVYEEHDHGAIERFDFFYEAQCVWDETMADNLATHLRKYPGKMVVFTGNGHIIRKYGIPDRTIRRYPVSMVTIMPYPLDKNTVLDKKMADYVWLTGPCSGR